MPAPARARCGTRRGALFERALLPFVPRVVVEEQLVAGQNPGSTQATARQVTALL